MKKLPIPGIKNYSVSCIKKKSIKALNEAIKIVGGHDQFVKQLKIYDQLLAGWKHNQYGVAPAYVIAIEYLTQGKVNRNELRIDIFQEK